MGKGNTKPSPRDELVCKDWKWVQVQDPSKVKHLNKWIIKYDFDGRLKSQSIVALKEQIKTKTKNNSKKMKKTGYDDLDFWLKEAGKREEGVRRRKDKEREEKDKQIMYLRKEDDETGPSRRRRQRERDSDEEEGTVEASGAVVEILQTPSITQQPTTPNIYPQLPQPDISGPSSPPEITGNPPPYAGFQYSGPVTRTRGGDLQWSRNMGAVFTPPWLKKPDDRSQTKDSDMYPMIEVANPNPPEEGEDRTMLVYRTWNMEDVKKTIEGVTSHKDDVNQFRQDMESIRSSYHQYSRFGWQLSVQIGIMYVEIGIHLMVKIHGRIIVTD